MLLDEVKSQAYQIEKLKAELAGHYKAQFGSRSESLEQLVHDREMVARDAVKRVPEIVRNHCPTSAKCAPTL